MAVPKTFTGGERLFADDLNGNFEALDTRLATAEFDINAIESAAASAAYVPSGAVFWFAANSAPSGYLECDGSAVSRSTYSALFAVVGTTFGSGDGSTTFNLPDLRGEFIRGWDNGRDVDSGRAFGSTQSDQNKAHTHSITTRANDAGTTPSFIALGNNYYTVTTASSGGNESRPRNVALMACIKS